MFKILFLFGNNVPLIAEKGTVLGFDEKAISDLLPRKRRMVYEKTLLRIIIRN